MPIYEYRCRECEQIFEEWQKGFEEKKVSCPVCGEKSERIISNSSFILKGGGWYATEYSNTRKPECMNTEKKASPTSKDVAGEAKKGASGAEAAPVKSPGDSAQAAAAS